MFRPYLTEKNPPDSTFVWKKADLKTSPTAFTNPPTIAPYNGHVTPNALFNLFFDDETIQLIVKMTNNHAKKHKGGNFTTNESEIRLFLAILLVSGYSELPRKHLYWERQFDVYNEAVATAMPCNQFDNLFRYLHLSDNDNPDENDKMWKIRPFYELINQKCLRYRTNRHALSIDESMVPYFGQNGCKQCIKNKPIRLGYKLWVLAESTGYVIHFDPYQGAKGGRSTKASPTSWGLGERTVLSLLDVLPQNMSYDVFFDNFFTSFRLLKHLYNNGIKGTGTVNKQKSRRFQSSNQKCSQRNPGDMRNV